MATNLSNRMDDTTGKSRVMNENNQINKKQHRSPQVQKLTVKWRTMQNQTINNVMNQTENDV